MGWTFACDTRYDKAALIRDLLGPGHRPQGGRLLAHAVVGNHLWQAIEYEKDGQLVRYIGLDLMKSGRPKGCDPMGWGYKDLEESMGLCEVDCPLRLLALVPEPPENYGWRERVRAYHARKNSARTRRAAFTADDQVTYAGHEYRLIRPSQSRTGAFNGWIVHRVSDGRQYRMRPRQLYEATTPAPSAEPAPVFTKQITMQQFIASTPGMADLFAAA